MSYVITNGEYYIKYLHRVQITKDIEESYKFETIDLAKEILQAAPNILKDYYVYNLKTQRKCWHIMTEEELEELRARRKIKRTKSGKIKRKTYSPDVKKLLYIKADGKCELCGKKILLDDMTIDHVKPLSMGGEDDVSNLACTCLPCNVFKGNILPENFLNRINDIFIYQTEKNTKHKLKWKIAHKLLLSCIK